MVSNENLYSQLCSYNNIHTAYKKARKGKTLKQYVIDFEENLEDNLQQIQVELQFHIYKPRPLQMFILRDPKTRRINKSAFRDRIVHHALCNIIEPLLDKGFIFDSYANRKGKGTFKAIKRFNHFQRKITKNNFKEAYVLKADIKHYFDEVNHLILIRILEEKISDKRVMWLIKIILSNYVKDEANIGMPLGNLTSQFFANVYLNELDKFVKQKLRIEYYIRYVDDFVLLNNSKKHLKKCKDKIDKFFREKLALRLHPDKSRIEVLDRGVEFLGMRIFYHHKLLKAKNLRKFRRKIKETFALFDEGKIEYDSVYDFFEGWCAYVKNANTYNLRKDIMDNFEKRFSAYISTKEINRGMRKERKKKKKNNSSNYTPL